MTSLDYIKSLQKVGKTVPIWNSVYLIAKELIEQGKGKLIQTAISKQEASITIDGVIGSQTVKLMSMCEPSLLLQTIGKLWSGEDREESNNTSSIEDKILSYLAGAESLHFHWNKTESNFTTPYGVYAKLYPNSRPIKWAKAKAKEKGYYPLTRKNIHSFDKSLTSEEKREFSKIAYDFYVTNFLNPIITEELHDCPKTALSVFSNGVNGGVTRGTKSLQSAIATKVDGKFGKGSLARLKICKTKLKDGELNQRVGDYMYNFYMGLVRRNPSKYGIYKKGWINRLKALLWNFRYYNKIKC